MWLLRQAASWLSLNLARSVPNTSTSPSVQRSIPASKFSSVDFPEPLGPISAKKSPGSILRSTWSSATTSNPSRAKRLLTLRTCTIGPVIIFLQRLFTDLSSPGPRLAAYRRRQLRWIHHHSILQRRNRNLRLHHPGARIDVPHCYL